MEVVKDEGKFMSFGVIFGDWNWYLLGDFIQLIFGQYILVDNYNSERIGILYLIGFVDFEFNRINVSKWIDYFVKKVFKGDIFVIVKGFGVGKVFVLDIEEVVISR